VRIAAISDTHGAHARLDVPACDLVVCAGDVTRRGTEPEVRAFMAWFAAQPGEKVMIGGNHDAWCEREPAAMAALAAAHGVPWLVGQAATVAGLRVWGSPMTPAWRSMAFNLERGAALARHWEAVPPDLDLLLTHGPPAGIGDRAVLGRVGCRDLRAVVEARAPRIHVFGHIHEARGRYEVPGLRTVFYNAASRGILPVGVRPPLVITDAT
jgi:Icc-related predicted phosphoesterase